MADKLQLVIEVEGRRAKAAIADLNNDLASLGQRGSASAIQASGGVDRLTSSLLSSSSAVRMLTAAFGALSLGALAKQAIALSGQFEQVQVGIRTMVGSVEVADKLLRDLETFARTSPFNFTELQDSTKRLLALGFAAEDVLPTIKAVGGAAAALGTGNEGISRITLALGQIKAAGKLTGMELRQLTEAGLPVFDILSQGFGKTTAEIKKAVEDGIVPADEAIRVLLDGLHERFGRVLNETSATTKTTLSNLVDDLERFGREFGDVFAKDIRDAVESVRPAILDFAKSVKEHAPDILAFARALGEVGTVFVTYKLIELLWGLAGAVRGVTAAMAANPVGLAAIALATAGTIIYQEFGKINDGLEDLEAKLKRDQILDAVKTGKSVEELKKLGFEISEIKKALGDPTFQPFKISPEDYRAAVGGITVVTGSPKAPGKLGGGAEDEAKRVARANEEARRKIAELQREEYEGVARLIVERDQEVAKLREKGASQQLLNQLQEQYNQNIAAGIAKLDQDLEKLSSDRLEKVLQQMSQWGIEALKVGDELRKANEQTASMYAGLYSSIYSTHQSAADIRKWGKMRDIDYEEAAGGLTPERQIQVNQRKVQIERDYQRAVIEVQLKALEQKMSIRRREIAADVQGLSVSQEQKSAILAERLAILDIERDLEQHALKTKSEWAVENAQKDEVTSRFRIIYDSNRRLFDQLKQSAEGVFDAMLTKSQSVWQAMANSFKMAFLTVFKEIVSSQIARSLTSLLTGQKVGLAPGTQAGTGLTGRLGGLLGVAGVGAVPVFGGGGVGYPGAPGGTPGFAGPVQSMGGGIPQISGILRGGPSNIFSTTVGGKTTWFNAATGAELTGNAASQAAFFGKFGKAGGAVKSGLFMAGTMLGMDGLMRGGLGGMLETTAGGAAIGTAIAPGIGTAIGAGIGAAVGGLRWLFGGKSPEDKLKERIKSITGVDVRQKPILKQWVQMSGNTPMMMDAWIRSRAGQEMIELYAQSTGQKFQSKYNVPQLNMIGSSGMVFESPAFLNGVAMNPVSNLPGFGLGLDSIRGGSASSAPIELNVTLDGAATKEFHETNTLRVIAHNPRAVQSASLSAQRSSAGRSDSAILAMSPSSIRA